MKVLCFDIASGGLSAAIIDEHLTALHAVEVPWTISLGSDGSAVLDLQTFDAALLEGFRLLQESASTNRIAVDGICISAFMHNCIFLDERNKPLSPIFTWLDRRGEDGVEVVRRKLGDRFHSLTGCRYHPMFPVFKIASPSLRPLFARFATVKTIALERLTGNSVEDYGAASAAGLLDVRQSGWAPEILSLVQLQTSMLPALGRREQIVGTVSANAAARYGIQSGVPVVAGSGDGFFATLGSGCERSDRIAITLGTSASVRRVVDHPVLDEAAGTFCYRADEKTFLLGCAGNNGGNVLDWARAVFGRLPAAAAEYDDLPVFIPLLNGERSPEWDPGVRASWHGVSSTHTADHLVQSVVDGVVFNLAHYVAMVERASGVPTRQAILSGNGFLNPATVQTLAALLDAEVRLPSNQGMATLRGAALCGLRGLGVDASAAVEEIVSSAAVISPNNADVIRKRFDRYMEIRLSRR